MNHSLMLTDVANTAEAVLVFSLIVLVPGYVLAWLFDLMHFRQQKLLTRLALAVPISIGVCPIVSYLLGRFCPPPLWVFYGLCTAGFSLLLFRERRQLLTRIIGKGDSIFLAIVAGWIVVATLTLIDLQIGNRLYFPTVAYDYSLRATVTASISRSGIPPQNPLFFPGRSFAMHYHYFWFILCSLAERIAPLTITSRHAVIAGTIWSGIGLMALVVIYVRFFENREGNDHRRRSLFALALLAVTGLDILPVIGIELASGGFFADFEWWNDQVSAWIEAVIWTPHHLAGLIACVTGFLLIWDANRRENTNIRLISAIIAGSMFASAAGLTIHVTLVFAAFLLAWLIIEFFRGHGRNAGIICLAGLAAAVFATPFLVELFSHEPGASAGAGGFPLMFSVRTFRFYDLLLGVSGNGWKSNLYNLLGLPINYLLELGFFLIVCLVQCRRMWDSRSKLTDDQLCSFTMAMTSIVICTFISSAVHTGNDLGWRGFLPAQFVLLIWGADLLARGLLAGKPTVGGELTSTNEVRIHRGLILATLALGAAGSFYALFKIRFHPVLSDMTGTPLYSWLSPDRQLGPRTLAVRKIYDELRRRTPTQAVFQHNPNISPGDLFHGIYADRQIGAEGLACGTAFGGDVKMCESRISVIDALFEDPARFDADHVDQICGSLSIDVLVVKDTDKVWKDPRSWVWKKEPMLANDRARAFACRPAITTFEQARR